MRFFIRRKHRSLSSLQQVKSSDDVFDNPPLGEVTHTLTDEPGTFMEPINHQPEPLSPNTVAKQGMLRRLKKFGRRAKTLDQASWFNGGGGSSIGDPDSVSFTSTLQNSTPKRNSTFRKGNDNQLNADFYQMTITIDSARDLKAMDWCGTSDPFVRIKLDGKNVYRSKTVMRNLSPVWNETCIVCLEKPCGQLFLSVWDYDRGSTDDFIGEVGIDISTLDIDKYCLINF